LISQIGGKLILDCKEIEDLEEYVLAGIPLPGSEKEFENTYPRKKINWALSRRGYPNLYDVSKSLKTEPPSLHEVPLREGDFRRCYREPLLPWIRRRL
jgi:hypothetical protein